MENLQNHMQYPTFVSLMEALEENALLLRATRCSVRNKARNMENSIQSMEESVQKLEENTICQIKTPFIHHHKAA